jgi:hypothetical protein
VSWISNHTGDLITEIGEDQKLLIRGLIKKSFEDGITTKDTAKIIQQSIGLHSRQAAALYNYSQKVGKLYDASKADTLTEKYSQRLLKNRAETIAKNETMTASNKGQHSLWSQAINEGYLSDDEFERRWILTPDDRLCEICKPLGGKRAAFNGTFEGGIAMPPRHIQCRCVCGVVRKHVSTIGEEVQPPNV